MRYYERNISERRNNDNSSYYKSSMTGSRNREIRGSYGDYSGYGRKEPRTKLVIDDNTIYEIDLDCIECMEKNKYKT